MKTQTRVRLAMQMDEVKGFLDWSSMGVQYAEDKKTHAGCSMCTPEKSAAGGDRGVWASLGPLPFIKNAITVSP